MSALQDMISQWTQAQNAAAPAVSYRKLYNTANDKYDAWKTGISDAQTRARGQIAQLLQDNGYSPDQFSALLDEQLGNTAYGLGDPGDPSSRLQYNGKKQVPGKVNYQKTYKSLNAGDYNNLAAPNTVFNTDSIANAIMDRIKLKQAHAVDPLTGKTQQQALGDYTNSVNALHKQYDPYSMFGTVNSDNAVIQNMLGTGYSDAATQVENASKRGTLNDVGKSRALAELGNQRTTGAQLLTQNANSIYSQDRQTLSDLLNKADTGLDAYKTTNTPFNFDSLSKQIGDTANNLQSGFEGALRNSANGQQFFDATKAINLGGGAQGGINPMASQNDSLAGAINSLQKKNAQPRTLGNSGAF